MSKLNKVTLVALSSVFAVFSVVAQDSASLDTMSGAANDSLISQYDTDNDGALSEAEVVASHNSDLISKFAQLDTNGDGKLSAEELESF